MQIGATRQTRETICGRNLTCETISIRAASLLPGLDAQAIATAIGWIRDAAAQGKTIFACGNGGSALIASHMASEMVERRLGTATSTGSR